MMERHITKEVQIGNRWIGGNHPIAIQSMTNTKTEDVAATVAQIKQLTKAGCEIIRCAVPTQEAAAALTEIKKQITIPLVADIHFDYRLAIAAMEHGADKIRINPGNIGSRERVKAVVDVAKERRIPIRVGVNSGSLEKGLVEKYHGVTAEGIVESAMDKVKLIEDMGYDNLVISIKSSDVMMCVKAHELIAKQTDHPLHVGITEAGTLISGNIKSAIGLGLILNQGIGDTIRVSLTGDPLEEIKSAKLILRTLGLRKGGVEVVSGEAEIKGRAADGTITIASGEAVYEAANLLICTGSETVIPPIPGLAETEYWTSREALLSKELPTSLVIIGGGVIGMEFASFFNSMGTEVHVVEMLDKILGPMDRELSEMLQVEYAKRGVKFYLGHKVTAVNGGDVTVEKDGETSVIQGEKILLSVGRRPVTKGFGLETLAPEPFRNGIKVNGFMQTSVPNVYACGDITAFSLLAHTAVSEAEVAVDHILGKNRSMSYKAIPGVVYTNPEIAGVGKTEEELQAEGTPYTVKKIPMAFSGRFVAENEQGNGVCKLILAEDETIIGAHLLGNPASELIVIAGIAVEKGMKASELKSIVFPHPTVGEILKEAL